MAGILNSFAYAAKNESNLKETENGMIAYKSSKDALVDLFGSIGALRERSVMDKCNLFELAYEEDPLIAVKILFYSRDIRGGLGERKTFRDIFHCFAIRHPVQALQVIKYIPEYGRWDDMYCLIDTPLEGNMWFILKIQFKLDLENMEENKQVSLLAKWLKTPDASSEKTKRLGIETAINLGYSVYEYKRLLRKLRKYIRVTEVSMSANEWDQIEYESVPSKAMTNYRRAFYNHDEERFAQYIEDVTSGKKKINSDTLYPYDLVRPILKDTWDYSRYYRNNMDNLSYKILKEQWKALPDYLYGREENIMVMADTSGSMTCNEFMPISSSIGLAIYFAERNKGAYHNLVMTFSTTPDIVEIEGNNLFTKVQSVRDIDWCDSTNIVGAFDKILEIAVNNNISKDEMPKALIIISDMEFDTARRIHYREEMPKTDALMAILKEKFEEAGYDIPGLIFWNVNARNSTWHVDAHARNIQLVSGSSASTFKTVIDCINMTPYEVMMRTINDDRYNAITLE